ncbi:uncharacterized protein C8A04DRAFT_31532 [Dichotomopilus funicola]|uniref:UmuC domain-containing protein n=1 Tax=Dichotomopilus funicola TaxID=1934379 RepID=A0AAN6ZJL8_9PEZI|nr:hypothetical protein C8A04DRAFT_31532 [Dichotomopilus funicola]
MEFALAKKVPLRRDDRVILHFCVENRQPSLRTQPLGIKQKSILATCNYVARRRGVKKLMLITQAKKICPDLVLADGEDLSPFRDVSKRLYSLLRGYSWSGKVERLGLDEVFLDVTDMVAYNVELLNTNDLERSFFCLSRSDPEVGFAYDARGFAGYICGNETVKTPEGNGLGMRLLVASHLAQYLRLKIEDEGYTTACGISTNKLLAKLVGDKNKPQNQTTLLALTQQDVLSFMDTHPLRKVPGIGSRTTRVLEAFVLNKPPDPDAHTMECSTTVGEVRVHQGMSIPTIARLLAGPGTEKGLGAKVWSLLHGVDDTPVKAGRDIPTQISIEDTYRGLTQMEQIHRELLAVTTSLLKRMHIDLLEESPPAPASSSYTVLPTTTPPTSSHPLSLATPPHINTHATQESRRWLARPKTIRLSTRPYQPFTEDPTAIQQWARTSRSAPLPSFIFTATHLPLEDVAARLVSETLLPLFYKMCPGPGQGKPPLQVGSGIGGRDADMTAERGGGVGDGGGAGWNVGLLNVCVTNMLVSGNGGGGLDGGTGDIGAMFRRQEGVLREFTAYADGQDEDRGDGGGVHADEVRRIGDVGGREEGEEAKATGEGDGERTHQTRGHDNNADNPWGIEDDDDVWATVDDPPNDDEQPDRGFEEDDDGLESLDQDKDQDTVLCPLCDRLIPRFAVLAHERFHNLA